MSEEELAKLKQLLQEHVPAKRKRNRWDKVVDFLFTTKTGGFVVISFMFVIFGAQLEPIAERAGLLEPKQSDDPVSVEVTTPQFTGAVKEAVEPIQRLVNEHVQLPAHHGARKDINGMKGTITQMKESQDSLIETTEELARQTSYMAEEAEESRKQSTETNNNLNQLIGEFRMYRNGRMPDVSDPQ